MADSELVRRTLERWEIPAVLGSIEGLEERCTSREELIGDEVMPKFVITFDGSLLEVPARSDYPSVRVEYLQLAGVYVDLDRFFGARSGSFIDPRLLAAASQRQIINAVLPGSNVTAAGLSSVETWRRELYDLFSRQGVSDFGGPVISLLDGLFLLHGSPFEVPETIALGRCPYRVLGCTAADVSVPPNGCDCPGCGRQIWPTDVLRSHEEFDEDGSNLVPLGRVMNIVERLLAVIYLTGLARSVPGALGEGAFVTDGPLAFFGTSAPLKRRMVSFLHKTSTGLRDNGYREPLVLGLEKSGIFVDHARFIGPMVDDDTVVMLDDAYIRQRIKRRPAGSAYGTDEYYGRRFFYKTPDGTMLVVTVPRSGGQQPYGDTSAESLIEYPSLRRVTVLLGQLMTRLYDDAVIPIALAHSAAALPLGTGNDVLRILAQEVLGLPRTGR